MTEELNVLVIAEVDALSFQLAAWKGLLGESCSLTPKGQHTHCPWPWHKGSSHHVSMGYLKKDLGASLFFHMEALRVGSSYRVFLSECIISFWVKCRTLLKLCMLLFLFHANITAISRFSTLLSWRCHKCGLFFCAITIYWKKSVLGDNVFLIMH